MLRVHHSDGKELLRGSILLLRMFLKYSLASRILSETSSKIDLQGCFFWQNLSMSDGFKGKHRVSIYSHLSFEVWQLNITNLLLEAEGLFKIWEFLNLLDLLYPFLISLMWEYKYEGHSTTTFFEAALRAFRSRFFVYRFRINNCDWALYEEIWRDVQLVFKVFFNIFPGHVRIFNLTTN